MKLLSSLARAALLQLQLKSEEVKMMLADIFVWKE